ncbi:coagulation factor XIII B chain isoform X7 [Oryzias melastigma]|uniref:coagulation factor XIII B chain isoform X7 n=1 Tax=Oryzias melastigma TaxID=30732 RepID=UPI00168D0BAB|nr:coagulation factor XIII B chain isoform X7 [Oryzias melastigma]
MWLVYCSFSFLVWLPGILSAQGTPQVCIAPSLRNGYFVPTKDSYQLNEKIIYACDYEFKPAVDVAQSICENGQWSPQPQCIAHETPQFCSAPNVENGYFVPIKESYQLNEIIIYACENGFKPAVDAIHSMCENGQWSPQPQCIVYSPGLIEVNTKPEVVPVENCGELPVVANGLVQQSENLALRVSCQMFYKLDGPEKVVCYSSNKWSEVPICKVNYCAVDTAAYEDVIPDGVKYVVNGEEIKLLCKDIFRLENHRYVRCRNGKATVSECCNRFQIYTSLNEREEEETVAFRISGWAENRYKHL